MKAAIIAAGLGERMAKGGISTPKPLIPVAGRPLISRVINTAAKTAGKLRSVYRERGKSRCRSLPGGEFMASPA